MEDRIRRAFRDETLDILSELDTLLLQLEEKPDELEAVSAIFRAFHTIKGSGAMSGFDEVSSFTHDIENVYDFVRSGRVQVDRPLIDLTLRSCDLIREMIGRGETGSPQLCRLKDEILSSFSRLLPSAEGYMGSGSKLDSRESSSFLTYGRERPATYRIFFAPGRGMLARGMDPVLLIKELRGLGICDVVAHTDAIPHLEDLDPEECYVSWEVTLTTNKDINAVRDVFVFAEGDCELSIDVIAGIDTDGNIEKKSAGIPTRESYSSQEDAERILLGDHDAAMQKGRGPGPAVKATGRRSHAIPRIKVSSQKLDTLVNLVGELVTVQARLSQVSACREDPELLSISEEVERLTEEIRDTTMNVRMLPIGMLFSRFRRLVRDLSLELGKEVEMTFEGAETELDKTVIEKLNDPMVHLIRNCIDHGIEPPELREATGKKRKGMVHLSANHSGGEVLIQIKDDGTGMDTDVIRQKATEKGLIPPDSEPTGKDLLPLIFLPGFTTADSVTNVSGRGVGMDVVKRAVDSLRGSIDVESEKGLGTAITLRLPLTLAIIEGLLVKVAEEMFVFPLSQVEECVELTHRDVVKSGWRHIANIRGKAIPYIRLREQFMFEGKKPEIEQIVIVKEAGNRVGFVVDEVVGHHQTVIKTLGRVLRDIEGISGATILGDGRVALIMDIPTLLAILEEEVVNRTGSVSAGIR